MTRTRSLLEAKIAMLNSMEAKYAPSQVVSSVMTDGGEGEGGSEPQGEKTAHEEGGDGVGDGQVPGLSDRGEAECYPHDEVADRSEAGAQGRHHRCQERQRQEDDPLRNDRGPQSQHEDEVRRPEDRRYRDVQPGLG